MPQDYSVDMSTTAADESTWASSARGHPTQTDSATTNSRSEIPHYATHKASRAKNANINMYVMIMLITCMQYIITTYVKPSFASP